MQAIRIENPPPTKLDEAFDITSSLDYIIALGDNSTMSIRDLTCKTAFLMALVSACHPSDLHHIDAQDYKRTRHRFLFSCIAPKEYNIAIAHSASTSKARSKSIFIGVYSDNNRLCPYEAITTLLSRTSQWRTSIDHKRTFSLLPRNLTSWLLLTPSLIGLNQF